MFIPFVKNIFIFFCFSFPSLSMINIISFSHMEKFPILLSVLCFFVCFKINLIYFLFFYAINDEVNNHHHHHHQYFKNYTNRNVVYVLQMIMQLDGFLCNNRLANTNRLLGIFYHLLSAFVVYESDWLFSLRIEHCTDLQPFLDRY